MKSTTREHNMADQHDEATTSRIQGVVNAQIARQGEICSANLSRVKDKIISINGDIESISTNLAGLRKEVTSLILDIATKFADLRLDTTKQIAAIQEQTRALEQASKQRWSIWPTLKDILIVILSVTSLALTVYALIK